MPRTSRKRTNKQGWTNRRVEVMAGGLIAALILVGLIIPLGAMQFENHDSFCAACHTEGEMTFFTRATAPAETDLASFHARKAGTRCIACHSGAGIVGRYIALTYGASDLVSYYGGHYPQPAVQDTPLGDGNCLKCHASVFDSQAFNNHFHGFLPRWQTLDPQKAARCVDCHLSHDTTNDAGAAFLNQDATTRICEACHAFSGPG